MRIVIDMQGAQTESRFRGIGRYAMGFAQGVVRNRGEHEVILALSGLFPNTIEHIRAAFNGLLPQENIRVWHAPGPVREADAGNTARREVAELIREAFLASLQPDVIHITSLFEGYVDDAVSSIGRFDQRTPVSVTLYDLIPLLNPDDYLKPNPPYAQYYQHKLDHLKQSSLLLSISDHSRQEGLGLLAKPASSVVNVSTAIEQDFQPIQVEDTVATQLRTKFGLSQPFVMYTGGADERKNLPRLIQAYAALPAPLRAGHQLLLAGKMPEGYIAAFKHLAKSAGLQLAEVCFTGYVTDAELIQLYNLCKLFVFPSWHEGFGLPALEAMACGAPVIAANTTSLPEVIGLDAGLFDPLDVAAIAAKMAQALVDDHLRTTLRQHGLQQAKEFTWDKTASSAIAAWVDRYQYNSVTNDYSARSLAASRLNQAIAESLPASDDSALLALAHCLALNQSAGVERQLLLDVSELCQRDSATGVQRVVRSYLKWLLQSPPAGFRVEPVFATQTDGYRYARQFTQRFLGQDDKNIADEPMRWQRGDIFFGLDMQHHVQLAHTVFFQHIRREGVTVKFLVYDLLPIQLADLFSDANARQLHEQLMHLIATTDGAICISKATADAFDAWVEQAQVKRPPNFQTTWVHIGGDIEGSQPSKGLPSDAQGVLNALCSRPSFLCVSTLEPRKGQQQIVSALEQLWADGCDVNLVLVGQQGWKTEALAEAIRNHPEHSKRLFWLQGISDEYLEQVYSACTCLIAASINEGFGLSLIEAARHGVPIVARDIPVFHEVAGDCAFYFTGDTAPDLATSLKTWLGLYQQGTHPKSNNMVWSTWQASTEKLKCALIQENYPRRQLLVDISELVQRDAKSGIQRVVRSLLNIWLNQSSLNYRIEPVYATHVDRYRYARRYLARLSGKTNESLVEDFIDYAPGDVFLCLDLAPAVVPAQADFYKEMRKNGVYVAFVIYDLLPLLDGYFEKAHAAACIKWLEVATSGDAALCISKSVAVELTEWINSNKSEKLSSIAVSSFHLGADISNSVPTQGLPENALSVIMRLSLRQSFLMVSTLAPHKGHLQVLDAFDCLWHTGLDINLVIVGKQGWMVDRLVERLRSHPERNHRLFWLEGISDEYLGKIYAASTCLIAASYGEGFGLPLIEAAQHKLPIIARDIPVFREVAGDNAYYFDAKSASALAQDIKMWLSLYQIGKHPKSDTMPWLTWQESAAVLTSKLFGSCQAEV